MKYGSCLSSVALCAALLVAGVEAHSAAAGAAQPAAGAKPRIGGTLKMGIVKDIGTPIPFVAFTSTSQFVKENLYEPLIMFDQKGEIHPWLASSWTPNANSTEWTFKLRQGVKFHDGRELVASDVVWSAKHIMNPNNGAAGQGQLAGNVRDVVAIDKYTVKFIAPGPRGLMPEILADTSILHIAPRESVAPGQQEMKGGAPPPGTGPFKFKAWIPGQEFHLVRNEQYWGGAPYLDAVRFLVIVETNSRAAAIQAGDLDWTERLGPTFIRRIESGQLKGLQFTPIGSAGLIQLVLNTELAPTSDPRIRKAIALSLDKEALMKEATFGYGVPVLTWAPGGSDWENSVGFKWKRNIEEAKRLLKEAGYAGKPITLGATRGQDDAWTEAIVRQGSEAGLKFSIQNLAGAELIQKTVAGELHMSVYGGGNVGEPLIGNMQYISCNNGKPGVGNVSNYCNAELEKLINQYMEEPNRAKRLAIWKQVAQKFFVDDVAYYALGWANTRNFVWRDKVKNWSRGPGQEYTHAKGGLWRTWLEQ
ncbi:MAG: ABC transporter substrate-binding protein [Deltaproteobacteria bacterium]|nr:ABC transporter substrate-binding protein [Deltaproteobacteria bacterium]